MFTPLKIDVVNAYGPNLKYWREICKRKSKKFRKDFPNFSKFYQGYKAKNTRLQNNQYGLMVGSNMMFYSRYTTLQCTGCFLLVPPKKFLSVEDPNQKSEPIQQM